MAAGEGEREPRPPERESPSLGCQDLPPERESSSRRRRDLPRGERETERGERKKKNGRDGKETSGSWMPGRDKVWFFSVFPLYFFFKL